MYNLYGGVIMNILLENLLETDVINCYTQLDKINSSLNVFYVNHDAYNIIKEELRLADIINNIKRISELRNSLLA